MSGSVLENFLRTFAHNNPELNYCQGMNYLIGFIYITMKNEDVSYKIFHQLINTHLKPVFTNHLEKITLKFYQFNRLLNIMIPELAKHFLEQKIDTHYYTTSWIITLFSQSYQYTRDSYLIKIIWDIFMAEKWKGFFKCALFILNYFKEALIMLDFDAVLSFMSMLVKNELFVLDKKQLEERKLINCATVKAQITNIPVTNRLLRQLEQDYTSFQC